MIAIDPGPTESAYVVFMGGEVVQADKIQNEDMLHGLLATSQKLLVIEQVASYGMAVGAEVFETVYWSGRFAQAFPGRVERLKRIDVKMALCHQTRGVNDSVIRQRLIDLWGGKEKAIGKKKTPGPLYGLKGDTWQALAVAVAWEIINEKATT